MVFIHIVNRTGDAVSCFIASRQILPPSPRSASETDSSTISILKRGRDDSSTVQIVLEQVRSKDVTVRRAETCAIIPSTLVWDIAKEKLLNKSKPCGSNLSTAFVKEAFVKNSVCGLVLDDSVAATRSILSTPSASAGASAASAGASVGPRSIALGAFFARFENETVGSKRSTKVLYVDLICVPSYGLETMAVIRQFAIDTGCAAISLSAVQEKLGFYQQAGYRVRPSCAAFDDSKELFAENAVSRWLGNNETAYSHWQSLQFMVDAARSGAFVKQDACAPSRLPALHELLDTAITLVDHRCTEDGISMKICDLSAASSAFASSRFVMPPLPLLGLYPTSEQSAAEEGMTERIDTVREAASLAEVARVDAEFIAADARAAAAAAAALLTTSNLNLPKLGQIYMP